MKKLIFLAFALLATLSAHSLEFLNREPDVKKGADYAFMKEDAKMWLYLDFTKAELADFSTAKSQKTRKTEGLYLETKTKEEWAEDFEALYFWTIKYWNVACDKRNIPLHMTADKDSAKYAMEFYVDSVDYGWPQVGMFVAGEGFTMDGTLLVRDLTTGETVYEADINKIKTLNFAPVKEVWRMRATLFMAILGPHFLGMDPGYMDVGDKATLMRYDKDYKPKAKKK